MKVYTRKGDAGETGLFGGSRISKSSLKVDAYGSIDEAAAFIGVARAFVENKEIKDILFMIQEKFLVVAAYLASDANGINKLKEKIEISDIEILEKYIDNYSKQLLPLYKFLIPGEDIQSAVLHVARTVVRRSERRIIALNEQENLQPEILKYVNRVSDILFVLNNEGNLILEEKMDNALLASVEIAKKKAYTAAALKIETSVLAELVQPGGSLYGLQSDSKYIVFGGGCLLKRDGEIVGAVGVSGGTVEEDMTVAKACVEAFQAE